MNLSRSVALFDALTSNAPANFGNVRISLTIVCFVLFPVSQGLACSWDLNGVGYPAECGYRGRGGGGGAPQPYVPSAAKRSDDINSAGVQASNTRNWALAASLFQQALQINPSSAVAAINLRNTQAIIVNEDGIKAFNARNWGLAESLFKRASQINPNDPAIANNLLKVRAIIQSLADQRATEEQNNAARDLINSQALAEAEAKRKAATDLINSQALADAEARRKAATDLINSAAATTPGGNTRRGTFGESVPDNPDIGPAEGTTKTTYSSASAQAAAAALDPNCVYDGRPGCAQGTSLQFPKANSPSAAINALAYSIAKNERAMRDPVITQSFAWYLSLDTQVKDKQAQIAEIQKQIDGGGDQKILNTKKSTLENDIQRSKTDQKAAMNQIKEENKKLNLGLDFPEEGPPPAPPIATTNSGANGNSAKPQQ